MKRRGVRRSPAQHAAPLLWTAPLRFATRPERATPLALAALLALGSASPTSAQDEPPSPDSVLRIEPVTVEVGRLRAGAVPVARTPFSAQVVQPTSLGAASGGAISGALSTLPGVTLSNQTGSGSQADIRLRGFTVSPIVGLPQSVSVFVDGVRVNEADASQVHLSLIPSGAVERIELIRGSGRRLREERDRGRAQLRDAPRRGHPDRATRGRGGFVPVRGGIAERVGQAPAASMRSCSDRIVDPTDGGSCRARRSSRSSRSSAGKASAPTLGSPTRSRPTPSKVPARCRSRGWLEGYCHRTSRLRLPTAASSSTRAARVTPSLRASTS